MKLFSFETSLSSSEITNRIMCYLENEQHSSWNIFEKYYSKRVGIHLYNKGNKIVGYYENGERNRHGDLNSAKLWFKFKIKEKSNKRTVSGYTYFCPILMLFFVFGLLDISVFQDVISSILLFGVFALFFFMNLKEEREAIECIENLLSENNSNIFNN